jgi:hypothetical protein
MVFFLQPGFRSRKRGDNRHFEAGWSLFQPLKLRGWNRFRATMILAFRIDWHHLLTGVLRPGGIGANDPPADAIGVTAQPHEQAFVPATCPLAAPVSDALGSSIRTGHGVREPDWH